MTNTPFNLLKDAMGVEETFQGKLGLFSFVLDDFEEYIKSYWTKTQSENWDDIEVLPESFRVQYIDEQFSKDWDEEDMERSESLDGSYYDGNALGHLDCFTIKNTPKNLELLEDEVYRFNVDEDDDSIINVESLTHWDWMYYTSDFYSKIIKDDLSSNTGIPIEDFQKENISVNG